METISEAAIAEATPVAYCEREDDGLRMTILRLADGMLVARTRRIDDTLVPTYQTGRHNDGWEHVRSGGRYVRHDDVLDVERGVWCHDYSSRETGRLWLRPCSEWEEDVGGSPRFRRLGPSMGQGAGA